MNAKQTVGRVIRWTVGLGLVVCGFATSCASTPPGEEDPIGALQEGAGLSLGGSTSTTCTSSNNGAVCGTKTVSGRCANGTCCTGCIVANTRTIPATYTCYAGNTAKICGNSGNECVGCPSTPDCKVGACVNGACDFTQAPDNFGCATGRCVGGVCCAGCIDANGACQAGTTTSVCGNTGAACASCDDGDPCTSDACDATSGCTHTFNPNGQCSDGNACTVGEHCVMDTTTGGISCGGGSAAKCDDNVDCTKDSCDPMQGCQHEALSGTACTDSGTCDANTVCQNGKCIGQGTPCNDNNPCTQNTCANGGTCMYPAEMPGTPCVYDFCHTGSTCQNSACQMGTAINCDDANPCTADSCDAMVGCVHQPISMGNCTDGDACTTGDHCANGICVGDPVVCTPLDECHKAGTCDKTAGGCSDPRQPDGETCTGGSCLAGKCVLNDGGVVIGSGGDSGTGGEAGASGGSAGSAGSSGGAAGSSGASASGGTAGTTLTPPEHPFVRDPGGCSCRIAASSKPGAGEYGLLALALGTVLARRRRR